MKTPDEIKKGLEIAVNGCMTCECCITDCPYDLECHPMNEDTNVDMPKQMAADALAYIQQLENHIGELTEKVAQIEAEQQNLICDFIDYINDGVQNPAPYCAFGGSCVLVDKRGWCRPGEHGCNGFVPKVRDDNENV